MWLHICPRQVSLFGSTFRQHSSPPVLSINHRRNVVHVGLHRSGFSSCVVLGALKGSTRTKKRVKHKDAALIVIRSRYYGAHELLLACKGLQRGGRGGPGPLPPPVSSISISARCHHEKPLGCCLVTAAADSLQQLFVIVSERLNDRGQVDSGAHFIPTHRHISSFSERHDFS